MSIARWTGRQIALAWVAGMALQLAIILVPALFVTRMARINGPRIRAAVEARQAQQKTTDSAARASRLQQIDDARASGAFRVTQAGDTVYGIVSTPTGYRNDASTVALQRSIRRTAMTVTVIMFGTIPLSLLLLTVMWLIGGRELEREARTRDRGSAAPA